MFNSIVKKIFLTIVGMFVIILFIQLVLHNFFLEDIYFNMKLSKVERTFDGFLNAYEESNWSKLELNDLAKDYEEESGASIIILNINNEILNNCYFETFNYLTLRTDDGKHINVIVDFLIDEEGKFRNDNNIFNIGEEIEVECLSIKGTNFLETLEIRGEDKSVINDEGYETWKELYKKNTSIITEISGVIIKRNFIIRDRGILSYQQERLWNEVKKRMIENNIFANNIFEKGGYEYVEEYSGLLTVVLVNKIEGINGTSEYVYSLFTLENIRDAFQILNGYYYYIFAIQIALALILVYFYSKWITYPLIRLIDVAKGISELDFTKKSHVCSNDELNILSSSLNNISNNLSTTIERLEDSNNELAIEAIKKAENEERMRNLLTGLSHEFKTPLGIMSGFLEIIRDGVYEKEPEYYIDVISDEIHKLNGLVLETIELSKLKTGSYKLNLSEFEIKPLIKRLIDKFEKQLRDKEMDIEINVEDKTVLGDVKKIEQAMTNLLSNGIRYSPNNQRIEIETKIENKKLYISIRNYGVLIDEEDLNKIWERFYRVEKSRNRELGGSGLGLTIVKNILELHEADYGVKRINNGIEFYFSLKLKD
ncbi:sensor histidine kinase [Anaeromicrobium sediminis]|uniref:histidine kinase n=1 Tax=Anaeromicrobium sediminis TaxID=1478221 RepID=A0A267MIV9_9FIRM|nr:ATP-binding protein [Anaeromicrobium sediminis]PAB58805.1 hypothetical protein CCE28_12985 [Anaeromicrobium sediminis]